MKKILSILSVTCLLLLVAGISQAADLSDASGSALTLLDKIKASSENWADVLRVYATRLFWSLAVIQLVWTMFPLVMKQADLGEILGELIRYVMTIGFFAALLLFSTDWGFAVIDSFRKAAAAAAGSGYEIKPGEIFGRGIEIAQAMWSSTSFFSPINNVALSIAGLLVLLCFSFIAAFMFVTLVESFFVVNAAVLFMGFGASQWTREYTLAAIRYCVSVGAKLFALTLLVSLVTTLSADWLAVYKAQPDEASVLTLVGLSLICCYFTKTLPELVQGMISGSSSGGGGAIGGMAVAGVAAVAAVAAGAAKAAQALEGLADAAGKAGGNGSGGDLASSLSDSLSSVGGVGNDTGSSAADSLGGKSGGSEEAGDQDSVAPRISGGSAANSSSAAPSRPNSGTGKSDSQAPKTSSGLQEASKQADSGKKSNDEQGQTPNSGAGSTSKGAAGKAAHTVADGSLKGLGMMAALSVPGMEGAASLSLGPAPQSSDSNANEADSSDFAENSENIIRSSGEASAAQANDESSPTPASNEAPASQNAAGPMDHATANGAFQETALTEADASPAKPTAEPKGSNENLKISNLDVPGLSKGDE